jgi:hypothetical protein
VSSGLVFGGHQPKGEQGVKERSEFVFHASAIVALGIIAIDHCGPPSDNAKERCPCGVPLNVVVEAFGCLSCLQIFFWGTGKDLRITRFQVFNDVFGCVPLVGALKGTPSGMFTQDGRRIDSGDVAAGFGRDLVSFIVLFPEQFDQIQRNRSVAVDKHAIQSIGRMDGGIRATLCGTL